MGPAGRVRRVLALPCGWRCSSSCSRFPVAEWHRSPTIFFTAAPNPTSMAKKKRLRTMVAGEAIPAEFAERDGGPVAKPEEKPPQQQPQPQDQQPKDQLRKNRNRDVRFQSAESQRIKNSNKSPRTKTSPTRVTSRSSQASSRSRTNRISKSGKPGEESGEQAEGQGAFPAK